MDVGSYFFFLAFLAVKIFKDNLIYAFDHMCCLFFISL